jgi:hypothetical protein
MSFLPGFQGDDRRPFYDKVAIHRVLTYTRRRCADTYSLGMRQTSEPPVSSLRGMDERAQALGSEQGLAIAQFASVFLPMISLVWRGNVRPCLTIEMNR